MLTMDQLTALENAGFAHIAKILQDVVCVRAQSFNGANLAIEVWRCEGHRLPKQPYMWAVRQGPYVLGKDGGWLQEPQPSSRDEEFYAEYRFDIYQDAERAAANCVPVGAINNARRGM